MQFGAVQRRAVMLSAVRFNVLRCSGAQVGTVERSAVRCGAVRGPQHSRWAPKAGSGGFTQFLEEGKEVGLRLLLAGGEAVSHTPLDRTAAGAGGK